MCVDSVAAYRRKAKPMSELVPLTCSSRVSGQLFLGVAGVCKSRIGNEFSVPRLAQCCRVLRLG